MKVLLFALLVALFPCQAIAVFKLYSDSSFTYKRDDSYTAIFVKMDGYIPFTSMHDITDIVRATLHNASEEELSHGGITALNTEYFHEQIQSVTAIRFISQNPESMNDIAFLIRSHGAIYIHLAVTEQVTMNTPNNEFESNTDNSPMELLTNFIGTNNRIIKGIETYSMIPLTTSRISVYGDFNTQNISPLFSTGYKKKIKSKPPVWMTLGEIFTAEGTENSRGDEPPDVTQEGASGGGVKKLKIGNIEYSYKELETINIF